VKLTKENTTYTKKTVNVMEEKYVPHVIEPSFGLGRIIYSILEHSFKTRTNEDGTKDEKRTFLSLPPKIAPVKVSILPLVANEKFDPILNNLSNKLLIQKRN
jgi:glycyl-tRNA synthetase